MVTKEEKEEKQFTSKRLILTSVLLFINISVLLFLFTLYFEYGATPIIIFLIFLFAFLTFFTPFFRKRKKALYSRIFPEKKKAKEMQRRQKEFIKTRIEPKIPQQKEIRAVNLDIKSRETIKPLIKKCSKCGMILPTFVKKCPNCSKQITD